MHEALLAAIAKNSAELTAASRDLTERFQLSRRMKVTVAIGAAVMLLLLLAVSGLVYLAVTNRAVLDTVHDCTNPHGKCARQGQRQTAAAVAAIGVEQERVDVAVTVCASSAKVTTAANTASDSAYARAIMACVTKRLAGG